MSGNLLIPTQLASGDVRIQTEGLPSPRAFQHTTLFTELDSHCGTVSTDCTEFCIQWPVPDNAPSISASLLRHSCLTMPPFLIWLSSTTHYTGTVLYTHLSGTCTHIVLSPHSNPRKQYYYCSRFIDVESGLWNSDGSVSLSESKQMSAGSRRNVGHRPGYWAAQPVGQIREFRLLKGRERERGWEGSMASWAFQHRGWILFSGNCRSISHFAV